MLPPVWSLGDQRVSVGEHSSGDCLLLLAIVEVTMENLLFANKNRLFIIRPTESQLPVCDCQPEGQTDRQTERVRERKDAFSLFIKIFFPFGKEWGTWWPR